MNLKISANTILIRRYLEVGSNGVIFCETATFGGVRRFRFEQVDSVLRGTDSTLSLQVDRQTFKIPVDRKNPAHRAAISRLVSELRRTVRRPPATPDPTQAPS